MENEERTINKFNAVCFTAVKNSKDSFYNAIILGLCQKLKINMEIDLTEKDATAIRKHCHQNEHHCSVDNFEIVGTAVIDFHSKLK